MDRRNIIQAYRQAPWRMQMQIIGLFLLVLVFTALVAGIYLNVTARAATIGRQIQEMQAEILVNRQLNADLETQLALLTSAEVMARRAEELGFRPAAAGEFFYVVVPGYSGRQPAVLAPPPGPEAASSPELPPEFTQSLIDWLRQLKLEPYLRIAGVIP